mmetsp:Transcript_7931/g.14684  ORF Transcript_7931/g.14684 Transcript_7931/m.14684 type:complete len:214 (+) Transcript_7931:168-809(+)
MKNGKPVEEGHRRFGAVLPDHYVSPEAWPSHDTGFEFFLYSSQMPITNGTAENTDEKDHAYFGDAEVCHFRFGLGTDARGFETSVYKTCVISANEVSLLEHQGNFRFVSPEENGDGSGGHLACRIMKAQDGAKAVLTGEYDAKLETPVMVHTFDAEKFGAHTTRLATPQPIKQFSFGMESERKKSAQSPTTVATQQSNWTTTSTPTTHRQASA